MLTKLKLALFISAPLVAGASTYALAQGGEGHGKLVEKFDANGDGALDDAERAQMKQAFADKRAAHKAEMLAKFDRNQDGQLDPNEKRAMRDAIATERFAKLDANGDGQLSLAEFKAGAGRHHGRHGHGRFRGTK